MLVTYNQVPVPVVVPCVLSCIYIAPHFGGTIPSPWNRKISQRAGDYTQVFSNLVTQKQCPLRKVFTVQSDHRQRREKGGPMKSFSVSLTNLNDVVGCL